MSIHNPPQYRYGLFKESDKKQFAYLSEVGKSKNWFQILGNSEDKNKFLITLIRTQKSLHDWRTIFVDMYEQIKANNTVDAKSLNLKYPPESISQEEPAWVVYQGDRIVSDFINYLGIKNINFIGSDTEIAEFILRFWLGQLGHDWEWTIMMIWEMLGDGREIMISDINTELKNFDYLGLFS